MGKRKKRTEKQKFAENVPQQNPPAENAKAEVKKEITPAQIEREYADVLNFQRKQRDNLLGNFTDGEYKIADEIKQELLRIPKLFGQFDGSSARVSTMLGRFVLNFRIDFAIDADICNAKIFFIEIEHDLEEDIKHETLLDEFEQPHTFAFQKIVFEKYHVYYDDSALEKDGWLKTYLEAQEEERLFLNELDLILSQLFVVRMLAYLDKLGELGNKIRVDFKLAMERLTAKNPRLAQDFALQKRLLDKLIVKHGAFRIIAKSEEGAKILTGFCTPIKNVRDKTIPSTIVEQKKADAPAKEEKKAAKSASGKKKSSAAKGGGSKGGGSFNLKNIPKLGLGSGGGTVVFVPQPNPAASNAPKPAAQKEEAKAEKSSGRLWAGLKSDVRRDGLGTAAEFEQVSKASDVRIAGLKGAGARGYVNAEFPASETIVDKRERL